MILIVAGIIGRSEYIGAAVAFVLALAYFTILVSSRGQTVGMMATGIRVTRESDGLLLSIGQAFVRQLFEEILYVVFTIPWIIDVLWPLWDAKNQTLHDKVVHSVVVHTR